MNYGDDREWGRLPFAVQNIHCTVKPTDLGTSAHFIDLRLVAGLVNSNSSALFNAAEAVSTQIPLEKNTVVNWDAIDLPVEHFQTLYFCSWLDWGCRLAQAFEVPDGTPRWKIRS